jgi:hypothetical protein
VVTARQRYMIRRLGRVYGIVGRVAGRYVAAGYSVELNHPTRYGPIHIVARGNGQVLAGGRGLREGEVDGRCG